MKSFKVVCITLAFVLLFGALGFGGYKLFEKFDSDNTTHADNVAKIYNVDVHAFDYSLEDVEGGLIDGVLVSQNIDSSKLVYDNVANLFNKMFVNRFEYRDSADASTLPIVYEGGYFVDVSTSGGGVYSYCAYYVGTVTSSNLKFYIYYKIVDDGIIFRLSKTLNVSTGTIDTPTDTMVNFSYELEDGYFGKNVVFDFNSYWFQVDYVESDLITDSLSETEMENVISSMFKNITDKNNETTYDICNDYTLSLTFANGWYGFTQPGTSPYPNNRCKVIARFVDGGVYFIMLYFNFGNVSTAIFEEGVNYFNNYELAQSYISRYSYELNEGFEYVETTVVPYLNNKYFFSGFQIDGDNTNYSFDNLNHAKEMLGITDSDGKFSMTARTDYEDYTEYVFNLSTDNMSLDFTVKVYKDNVCVLDYDKYYYVDKDGVIQTFSLEDITKENSPFVYYYETATDYYYLRRIDVLTSYQLKISKEILSLNLNKEVA